jgi:uncharacterized protein
VDELAFAIVAFLQQVYETTRQGLIVMDEATQTELEAAAFRRLLQHLRDRHDVQNIDMMNLAGFCRNCLSNWMQDAAKAKGLELTKDAAREQVYGMPFETWKALYQKDASPEQQQKFAAETAKPKSH